MRIPQEKLEKIVELRKEGKTNKEVAEILELKYNTVKTIAGRLIGNRRASPTYEVCPILEEARLTMTAREVSVRHGISYRQVLRKTQYSKMQSEFKQYQKPVMGTGSKAKKPKVKKAPKDGNKDLLYSGHAKVLKNQRVFKTVNRDPNQYRSISMGDSKNTIKQVKKSDPRTDEEVRIQFFESQMLSLKNL